MSKIIQIVFLIHLYSLYTLSINTLKTLIKLADWRKTTNNYRAMGSVWVLFFLSAHSGPIYPTHFAGIPYIQPASGLQLFLSNAR